MADDGGYRTFVDKKDRRIVAKLIKVEGEDATIERRSDKKQFTLAISSFSEADQAYIRDRAKVMEAEEKADKPEPEGDRGRRLFEFQTTDYKTKKTDHFLIRYNGQVVEPAKSYAEEVWDECAKVMPKLESDFKSGFRAPGETRNSRDFRKPDGVFRFRIYMIDDNPTFFSMAKEQVARQRLAPQPLTRINLIQTVGMFDDFENRFLVQDVNPGRGPTREVQMSHGLASSLLQMQARKGTLPLWLAAGIGYHIEHEMFDRCRVYYLNFSEYYKGQGGKIEKGEILDGDTPWTKPIRRMVKAGNTESLQRVVTCEVANMTPPVSGFIFGLTSFMLSTEARAKKYHRMIQELAAGQEPSIQHLLKCYGYDSEKAFERAWYEYLGSAKFK